MLSLPKHIETLCQKLEEKGFAAYAVGGCVRDLLCGKTPGDYDVTSSALPADVKGIFPHTADTGIAHGTVTVVLPEGNVEVTTFRKDGDYKDSRHPDGVTFVSHIEADLARRDFTVNAMAYSPLRGFVDPFGGKADLQHKILRTVGDPEVRFSEDALRILRLYRFSAQLAFEIEEKTEMMARKLSGTLCHVSRERIFAELSKLLHFASASDLERAEVIFRAVMPEVSFSADDFEKAASCTAMAGKWAHLCGRAAADILRHLRAPRKLIRSAEELATYRKGKHIVADVSALSYTTPHDFFAFLQDTAAENEWLSAKKKGFPMHVGELAVCGADMKALGFSGKEIGEALERLFMYVIENPANNKKDILMEVATWIYK